MVTWFIGAVIRRTKGKVVFKIISKYMMKCGACSFFYMKKTDQFFFQACVVINRVGNNYIFVKIAIHID